jgi:hypothetical protein
MNTLIKITMLSMVIMSVKGLDTFVDPCLDCVDDGCLCGNYTVPELDNGSGLPSYPDNSTNNITDIVQPILDVPTGNTTVVDNSTQVLLPISPIDTAPPINNKTAAGNFTIPFTNTTLQNPFSNTTFDNPFNGDNINNIPFMTMIGAGCLLLLLIS